MECGGMSVASLFIGYINYNFDRHLTTLHQVCERATLLLTTSGYQA